MDSSQENVKLKNRSIWLCALLFGTFFLISAGIRFWGGLERLLTPADASVLAFDAFKNAFWYGFGGVALILFALYSRYRRYHRDKKNAAWAWFAFVLITAYFGYHCCLFVLKAVNVYADTSVAQEKAFTVVGFAKLKGGSRYLELREQPSDAIGQDASGQVYRLTPFFSPAPSGGDEIITLRVRGGYFNLPWVEDVVRIAPK